MKKLYAILSSLVIGVAAHAATINVTVGGASNVFTPSSFTAVVGDVVVWTWAGGTHDVTSGVVPAGAATFASGIQSSGTYSYTITTAGTYGYGCSLHAGSGMVGSFTVSSTGIVAPATDLLTNAYPNPFQNKLTLQYRNVQSVEILNVIGEKVRKIELSATETKTEIDFEGMPSGVYFIRTYNEGVIMETKKIVKAK